MSNRLEVYGSISVLPLVNGDTINARLESTQSLYQTFRKGTEMFNPNWVTMPDKDRPIIFPRIYSSNLGGEVDDISDVSWKYNQQPIIFDSNGVASSPGVIDGKIKKVIYEDREALKLIGNVASDENNTSDTITFTGRISVSGQEPFVSAETTILIEEATGSNYRLLLEISDHIIDGDETGVDAKAILYVGGQKVTNGVKYQYLNTLDQVLRDKSESPEYFLSKDLVHGEIILRVKAFVDNVEVAEAQRQVLDWTDPYAIQCTLGGETHQDFKKDTTYIFNLVNQRTGMPVADPRFDFAARIRSSSVDIAGDLAQTDTTITLPGATLNEHGAIDLIAGPAYLD